jgi:predicted heme/steroid binding protein
MRHPFALGHRGLLKDLAFAELWRDGGHTGRGTHREQGTSDTDRLKSDHDGGMIHRCLENTMT